MRFSIPCSVRRIHGCQLPSISEVIMSSRGFFVFVPGAFALVALLVVSATSALPGERANPTGPQDIHPRRATLLNHASDQAAVLASAEARPGLFAVWHVEFDSPEACKEFHV